MSLYRSLYYSYFYTLLNDFELHLRANFIAVWTTLAGNVNSWNATYKAENSDSTFTIVHKSL